MSLTSIRPFTVLAGLLLVLLTAGCAGVREKGPVVKKLHYPGSVQMVNGPNGPILLNHPDSYALLHRVTLTDGSTEDRAFFVSYGEWVDAKVGATVPATP